MLEGDEDWLCQSCEDDAPVDHEPDWGFWVSAPGPRTESGEPW
jgi:hypothetical protein